MASVKLLGLILVPPLQHREVISQAASFKAAFDPCSLSSVCSRWAHLNAESGRGPDHVREHDGAGIVGLSAS